MFEGLRKQPSRPNRWYQAEKAYLSTLKPGILQGTLGLGDLMSNHRFSRNGQKLYYESYGEGPPLIFIHSYLANRTMWDQEVARFSKDHHVLVVDLRGHGHSGASAPHTLYDMVDDVIAVLDHAKVQSAIWCGLSIGGMITINILANLNSY